MTSAVWRVEPAPGVADFLKRCPPRRRASLTSPLQASKRLDGPRLLLTDEAPEVTLDRLQSATGSMSFELVGQGELGVYWELADTTSGLVSALAGQKISPEFGRRPIVEQIRGQVVVGLRHVDKLRRLVVLIEAPPAQNPLRLIGRPFDGTSFDVAFARTSPVIAAVAIYHVAGELVVRREGFEFDSRSDVGKAYGFDRNWISGSR